MIDQVGMEVADIAQISACNLPKADPEAPLVDIGGGVVDIQKPVILCIGHNILPAAEIVDYLKTNGLYGEVEVCGLCCSALDVTRYNPRAKIVGPISWQLRFIRSGVPDVIVVDEQCVRTDLLVEAQKSKGSDYAAMVEAEFEPFLYREVVPKLTHSIFAALPNGINNPEQKSLYEAFSRGDVEAVLATERKDRRQIFVTGMAIRYMRDVNTPNFEGTDVKLMSQAGIGSGDYSRYYTEAREKSYRASYADPTGIGAALPKTTGGFAVTIAGYSPYKNLSALLAEAGPDRRRWGVVTRLAHLDEMGIFPPDVNCPFELYKVGEDGHFKLDKGPVETGFEGRSEVGTMPPGIGLLVNRFERGKIPIDSERDEMIEKMLIDPMTKETISKVVELDQYGRKKTDRFGNVIETVNDNWFLLSLKFAWKEAPDPPAMPAPPPSVYEQEEDTWGTGRSGDSWESPSSTGTGSSGTTTDDFEL